MNGAVDRPTRGEVEAQIANAVGRFQREQQGRGPTDVRAHLVADLVVVRSTGILTQTETILAGTPEGARIVRSARQELRSIHHEEIESLVGRVVGCAVLRSYYDMDVAAAEQVEIYALSANADGLVRRPDPR